jgi:hypothetical protein
MHVSGLLGNKLNWSRAFSLFQCALCVTFKWCDLFENWLQLSFKQRENLPKHLCNKCTNINKQDFSKSSFSFISEEKIKGQCYSCIYAQRHVGAQNIPEYIYKRWVELNDQLQAAVTPTPDLKIVYTGQMLMILYIQVIPRRRKRFLSKEPTVSKLVKKFSDC